MDNSGSKQTRFMYWILLGIALLVACKLTIGSAPPPSSTNAVIDCKKVQFDAHKYEIDDSNVTGFMLKILNPPVLYKNDISVTLTGIARFRYCNTTPPSHDEIAMILQSESLPRKHEISPGDVKFADGSAGRAGGGFGNGASMGWLYADAFNMPSSGDKSLREYSAKIDYEPNPVRHRFGPYTINDLSKPIVFGKGKPILVLADLSVVQKPSGYTNYDSGHFGSSSFLEFPKSNYSNRYVTAQLYFVNWKINASEPYHIYVYGTDGRRIELQEHVYGNGFSSSSLPDPWINSYDGLSVEQIAVKPPSTNQVPPICTAASTVPPNTLVVAVDPNGPAYKAGIRIGDILVYTDLSRFYSGGRGTGISKPMTIIRNGQKQTVTVVPGDDLMFPGLRERRKTAWAQLEKHLPNVHARALSAEGYASEEPVPTDFHPKKLEIWFDTPRANLELKNPKHIYFTFQNIPIPLEFWNSSSK